MRTFRTTKFTLTELLTASAITVILVASILPIAISLIKSSYISSTKMELRERVNTSRGWLANDLRGTAKDSILTYPADGVGNLTAISLLGHRRLSAAEIPIDVSTIPAKIKWNQEVIYLVKQMPDGTFELHRSLFSYDYQTTTTAIRQARLDDIVANGTPSANNALIGTRTILKNITNYSLTLGDNMLIDGYSPAVTKKTVVIGTAVLSAADNPHTLTFITRGKNTASSGYKIGIDSFIASQMGQALEGEDATVSSSSPSATNASPSSGIGWSNHQVLEFPATTTGSSLAVNFGYETLEDSNFNTGGFVMKNTRGNVLTVSSGVYDQVLQMNGSPITAATDPLYAYSLAWQSTAVAGGNLTNLQNNTVRTVIPGGSLQFCGRQAKIKFSSRMLAPLPITSAYLMQRSGTTGFVGTGTPIQLKFGGATSVNISANTSACSDVVVPSGWGFDRDKDYIISFTIADNAMDPNYGPWYYLNQLSDDSPNLDLAMSSYFPGTAYVAGTAWPSSGTGKCYDSVGVSAVGVSYPDGTIIPSHYTSQIIDTKKTTSSYSNSKASWTTSGTDGYISVQVRSGTTADLSDLGGPENGWSSATTVSGGSVSLSSGRYLQFRVNLYGYSPYSATPIVKDVKLTWDGEPNRMSQLSADILCGPDRGIFEVQIDGQSTANPLIMLMNFTTAKRFMGKDYTDSFALSVKPQNKTPQ